MKKALIFGFGTQYNLFIQQIQKDFDVIGVADNNPEKWGGGESSAG